MMNTRTFTLNDGTVTIRRTDGPPCPAWHCIISQPPRLRAAMAYTARDALHTARVGTTALALTVAAPPPAPPAKVTVSPSATVPLAAVKERINHACAESMALRHRIGTKEPLAALDVLVEQAIAGQQVGILIGQLRATEARIQGALRAQERLQKELDELRAQLATAKPEPEAPAKAPAEAPVPAPMSSSEPAPGAPGEAAAPTPTQEARS